MLKYKFLNAIQSKFYIKKMNQEINFISLYLVNIINSRESHRIYKKFNLHKNSYKKMISKKYLSKKDGNNQINIHCI